MVIMLHPTERADARANRRRLIAAAHEVIRERGIDAEMKEIAERAGLGVGTIYRNFPTKEHLVAEIMNDALDEFQQLLDAIAEVEDPAESIRTFLRRGCDISERYGVVLLSMFGGSMPAGCEERFQQLKEEDRISEVVEAGKRRGIFRDDIDPAIVASQVVAPLIPWSYQQLRRTRSQAQIVDAYLDLILHGIMKSPAA